MSSTIPSRPRTRRKNKPTRSRSIQIGGGLAQGKPIQQSQPSMETINIETINQVTNPKHKKELEEIQKLLNTALEKQSTLEKQSIKGNDALNQLGKQITSMITSSSDKLTSLVGRIIEEEKKPSSSTQGEPADTPHDDTSLQSISTLPDSDGDTEEENNEQKENNEEGVSASETTEADTPETTEADTPETTEENTTETTEADTPETTEENTLETPTENTTGTATENTTGTATENTTDDEGSDDDSVISLDEDSDEGSDEDSDTDKSGQSFVFGSVQDSDDD